MTGGSTVTTRRASIPDPGCVQPVSLPGPQAARRWKLLVVEDEKEVAELIKLHLEDLPSDVTAVVDGLNGLAAARSAGYDLIVLDIRLPGCDGLEICRTLRSEAVLTPILFVSAKNADIDKVVALELGADDFLSKPFNVAELAARAKALLRRSGYAADERLAQSAVLRISDVVIDPAQRRVTVAASEVDLTSKEFDLLLFLAKNRSRVFTRPQILDAVWKRPYEGYEHNVNCHINRLRLKMELDPRNPRYIVTVWGVGYKFVG